MSNKLSQTAHTNIDVVYNWLFTAYKIYNNRRSLNNKYENDDFIPQKSNS